LVAISTEKLQRMVEDYIMVLKKKINPNSVPNHYYPLQSFFEANNIELRWKKIKKLFPAKIKTSGGQAYTTEDIQKMLEVTTNKRSRAIILFLSSTACRIGAITELKLKNLIDMPMGCKAVLIYEDTPVEYYSFLTPESSRAIDEYFDQRTADGEILNPESPVFRRKYIWAKSPAEPLSVDAAQNVVLRAIKKAGLRNSQEKKNGRYSKQQDHAFRKRFATILKLNKDIPVAITERLLGHFSYKDEHDHLVKHDKAYMRVTLDELFEYFKLAIQKLTIDSSERLTAEKLKLEREKSALEKTSLQVIEYKNEVNTLEKEVQRIGNLVEQMVDSKFLCSEGEDKKQLLLQSLQKEHQVLQLDDSRYIVGKQMPVLFRFKSSKK